MQRLQVSSFISPSNYFLDISTLNEKSQTLNLLEVSFIT